MDAPLAGRVALVTGGGRGIGRRLGLGLAAAGADVAVVSRTGREVDLVAAEIRGVGRRALPVRADIASQEGAVRAVEACAAALGPPDVLINAAAVQEPIGPFHALDMTAWAHAVQVNLTGLAYVTHFALRHMLAAGRGKIVNLSGGGAAAPRPYFSAYGASKAAVVRFTETLAAELRDRNIQVNAIGPGATRTRMTEEVLAAGERAGERARSEAAAVARSGGTPAETQVALVVFLAGDGSNHVTGRFLHVNDPWAELLARPSLPGDLFTLRRVEPAVARAR